MIPLKCPLRWLTGIVCPTCGLGHSLFYSFKFSFVQAATHHPLGPIFFGLGLLFNFAILMGRAEELIVGTRALGQRFATMNSGAFAFIIYCIWGFSRNF
ncbi:MAG: DUF2752 domain-containing protein [Bacteriovoracaceae bacterium]|nr:DUF2752 domain-containing protein [Bacteriovoracaceae bacterium]